MVSSSYGATRHKFDGVDAKVDEVIDARCEAGIDHLIDLNAVRLWRVAMTGRPRQILRL